MKEKVASTLFRFDILLAWLGWCLSSSFLRVPLLKVVYNLTLSKNFSFDVNFEDILLKRWDLSGMLWRNWRISDGFVIYLTSTRSKDFRKEQFPMADWSWSKAFSETLSVLVKIVRCHLKKKLWKLKARRYEPCESCNKWTEGFQFKWVIHTNHDMILRWIQKLPTNDKIQTFDDALDLMAHSPQVAQMWRSA